MIISEPHGRTDCDLNPPKIKLDVAEHSFPGWFIQPIHPCLAAIF